MNWHALTHIERSASDEVAAEGDVPADSPWFSGHFPHEPILPGIAQLAMVFDAVRQAVGAESEVRFTEIRRIRFKRIIRPGDRVRVQVAPVKPGGDAYAFKIMVDDEIACSGNVTALLSGR